MPELARIRRDVEKQKRLIQESLRAYLRRLAEGGAVQDELVTIRGERFVIPVKSEQKRRVNGVVHNIDGWYTAFDVKPGEKLYVAPADRVHIW